MAPTCRHRCAGTDAPIGLDVLALAGTAVTQRARVACPSPCVPSAGSPISPGTLARPDPDLDANRSRDSQYRERDAVIQAALVGSPADPRNGGAVWVQSMTDVMRQLAWHVPVERFSL